MVQPEGIDLIFWAGTLVTDFPNDDVPILVDEGAWKQWGNDLVQCNSFAINNAPNTNFYEDWKAWAWDVFYTMNNFA